MCSQLVLHKLNVVLTTVFLAITKILVVQLLDLTDYLTFFTIYVYPYLATTCTSEPNSLCNKYLGDLHEVVLMKIMDLFWSTHEYLCLWSVNSACFCVGRYAMVYSYKANNNDHHCICLEACTGILVCSLNKCFKGKWSVYIQISMKLLDSKYTS